MLTLIEEQINRFRHTRAMAIGRYWHIKENIFTTLVLPAQRDTATTFSLQELTCPILFFDPSDNCCSVTTGRLIAHTAARQSSTIQLDSMCVFDRPL